MRQTKLIMGMPITLEIVGHSDAQETKDVKVVEIMDKVFDYFRYVDEKFSTYKPDSEISLINKGLIKPGDYSEDMKEIFALSQKTKIETNGYFDIVLPAPRSTVGVPDRGMGRSKAGYEITQYEPSGMVKGWAIHNAAKIIERAGFKNFFVDAGGDVETRGKNAKGDLWSVGIRHPFDKVSPNNGSENSEKIVKVIYMDEKGQGVATSGTYIRGQHIYDPKDPGSSITDIVSMTIIARNIYEADRFATAAFAMGRRGIEFVEHLNDLGAGLDNGRIGNGRLFEGYIIDRDGIATMTSGFEKYTLK